MGQDSLSFWVENPPTRNWMNYLMGTHFSSAFPLFPILSLGQAELQTTTLSCFGFITGSVETLLFLSFPVIAGWGFFSCQCITKCTDKSPLPGQLSCLFAVKNRCCQEVMEQCTRTWSVNMALGSITGKTECF